MPPNLGEYSIGMRVTVADPHPGRVGAGVSKAGASPYNAVRLVVAFRPDGEPTGSRPLTRG